MYWGGWAYKIWGGGGDKILRRAKAASMPMVLLVYNHDSIFENYLDLTNACKTKV